MLLEEMSLDKMSSPGEVLLDEMPIGKVLFD